MQKLTKKQTYQFGIMAEKLAIILLFFKGYKILKWRHKTPFGELDIIAWKPKTIIIVEVKARKHKARIEEVISPRQINRIKRAALFFITQNAKFRKCDLRFDFIAVNSFFYPQHYKNFLAI